MTNYSDLQSRVADWLNRDDLTSAQIDSFISLAEGRFNRRLIVPARELKTTITAATTGRAPLPSDYCGTRAAYIAGQTAPKLAQMSLTELVETYLGSNANSGDIANYAISGTDLVVGPVPSANVTVTLIYWQTIPALTASNTANWLSTAYPDIYLSGVLTEALLFLKDYQGAALFDSRTEAKIAEAERAGVRKMTGASPLRARGTYRSIPGVQA